MADITKADPFEQALAEFQRRLKPKHKRSFTATTLENLRHEIGQIQDRQNSSRRLQNMARLNPFLEAMEQIGKVIEIFTQSSEVVAFVWGPMKFLLLTASSLAHAFTELLEVYQSIGEKLPLLLQYQKLFEGNADMHRVLVLMYRDILDFHTAALEYFEKPVWQQIFKATWNTYKSCFTRLISSLDQHAALVRNHATLSEITRSRTEWEIQDAKMQSLIDTNESRRRRDVLGWLKPVCVENEQSHLAALRREYPHTGSWLLDNDKFKAWFSHLYPTLPTLLWLNGIPGAGKTVLASVVIEAAENLDHAPTVVYFYCKSNDAERNSFASIGRSILSQLLAQDKTMMLQAHDEFLNSSEPILTSHEGIQELLHLSIRSCESVYIILDGIDECPRDQRKTIASWFRKVVEDLPPENGERVRCLFISQDDGIARRDFIGITAIKISPGDNADDISEFSRAWALRSQPKFDLSDTRRDRLATHVARASGGMFLLAKLTWDNLFHQTNVEDFDQELEPGNFPLEINNAYRRILARIDAHASVAERRDRMMLLGWLACSKRPLKWYEIQVIKSVKPENRSLELWKRRFRVDSKDLCGSLVEIKDDGVVELVHSTARMFLLDEQLVVPKVVDLGLSERCLVYLGLPGFDRKITKDNIRDNATAGTYGFLDYATLYWFRHLETALAGGGLESEHGATTIANIDGPLELFIDQHWSSPTKKLDVSARDTARLRSLAHLPSHQRLEQAVVSSRKQATFYGEMKPSETALDLAEVVGEIRQVLEDCWLSADESGKKELGELHGTQLFKCPRFSCNYFTVGFATKEQRENHLQKHLRPFRCDVNGCPTTVFGVKTASDLERHKKANHGDDLVDGGADDFPRPQDVLRKRQSSKLEEFRTPSTGKDAAEGPSQTLLDVDEEIGGLDGPARKRYKCHVCPNKSFTKKFNLQSHLLTHSESRDFVCPTCQKDFIRQSDLKRHSRVHILDADYFVCGGILADGSSWGCGMTFSRSDTLASHHKSQTGQVCLQPWLEEEQQI
ncbi:putative zinc finger protein [Rhypophila decipiens]|uniref:Zinc finger protein n=1 Tax=Rhypophila decipiens TaxID=261697 RepID=A0AAN6XW79_9PEZI|nr:putative zinc finger protein [Rhypophila decipiens]